MPDNLERILDEHERRIVYLESATSAQQESLSALRALMQHMTETVNQVSARVTAVRDLISDYEHRVLEALKEHEQREEAKWEDDHRYREARERDDKRQQVTSIISLLSILATFGAVLLAWWLGAAV
jgi:hypothetical protein